MPLPVEQADDRLRVAREMLQDSRDFYTLSESGLIERYKRSELHLVVRRSLPDEPQYGFLLHAHAARFNESEVISNRLSVQKGEAQRTYLCGQEPLVISGNIEMMEKPKRLVPSLIRTQKFDDLTLAGGNFCYKFVPLVFSPVKLLRHC